MKEKFVGSGPAYLLALALMAFPLADTVLAVWPAQPGSTPWRFGAFGTLAGSVVTPCVGLVGLLVIGGLAGHTAALRLAGVLGLLAGLGLLGWVPLFAIDAIDMRSAASPEAQTAVLVASAVAAVKGGITALLCLMVGWVGLRHRSGDRQRAGDPRAGVVVGRG